MGNSTPCKIVTPENIILKLCIRDYVGEMTHHANFGFNRCSGGFSPNRRNVTTLWLFWLSCPYLFFSILRSGRTDGPIFTLYGSNDNFPPKDGPFALERWVTIFGGTMPAKPPKMGVNKQFQPKTAKYKNRNISKTINVSRPHLRTELIPTIALRGLSNITYIKSNMAAGRHLEKIDMTS